jgi:hypothetical protein
MNISRCFSANVGKVPENPGNHPIGFSSIVIEAHFLGKVVTQELSSVNVSPPPINCLTPNGEFFQGKITLDIIPPGD